MKCSAKGSIRFIRCVKVSSHFELGRRPRQPAYPGKVDSRKRMWLLGEQASGKRRPSIQEGFFVSVSHSPSDRPGLPGNTLLCEGTIALCLADRRVQP